MYKVHLDTDIGGDPDDLCALAMLLNWPEVQIAGITTVCDDRGKRAGYAKYALKTAGREEFPVKAGADISGGYYRPRPDLPDEKAYWPEPVEPAPNEVDEALELLKQSIDQEALILAIGPYTNLFLLDQKYPGILQKANLYLMGGYVYSIREGYPQWGNEMDWNIQADVVSARHVIEHSSPALIPLTVSVETAIRRAYLPALRESGKLGEIIAMQAEAVNREYDHEGKIGKTCKGLPEDILNFQHDPLACAIALGWNDGVEIQDIRIRLEIKDHLLYEIPDENGKRIKLITRVDGDRFNQFWLDMMTNKPSFSRAAGRWGQ